MCAPIKQCVLTKRLYVHAFAIRLLNRCRNERGQRIIKSLILRNWWVFCWHAFLACFCSRIQYLTSDLLCFNVCVQIISTSLYKKVSSGKPVASLSFNIDDPLTSFDSLLMTSILRAMNRNVRVDLPKKVLTNRTVRDLAVFSIPTRNTFREVRTL